MKKVKTVETVKALFCTGPCWGLEIKRVSFQVKALLNI